MYIRKIEITNIRSIDAFTMEFLEGQEAGWHVLIGNNGAGKSTILQTIAMGIMGPDDVLRLDPTWSSWVKKGQDRASIILTYRREEKDDLSEPRRSRNEKNTMLEIIREGTSFSLKSDIFWQEGNITHKGKRFYCGFGPFRRFTGGRDLESDEEKMTPLTPFESLFKPELLLNASLLWIKDQYLRSLEKRSYSDEALYSLEIIKQFLSSGDLLPNGIVVDDINADGVYLKTQEGITLHINEFSDGIKSTLALTLEIFRLLLTKYGADVIQKTIHQTGAISVPGVVLIDEIDAHLHPTWQTRIGQWFTRHFPQLQFIVTTHSPLICRGCVDETGTLKGSIWHLESLGSEETNGLVGELERDRLVFGNVLDAYGTGIFGEHIERPTIGNNLLKELARLDKLFTFGQINPKENERRLKLQKIFTTDVISDF